MNYNRVILAGRLTRDPQLTYTPGNTAVCKFGIASNRKWRDRDGNTKEEVLYVDVVAFGKQAEVLNQYLAKGRSLMLEGRLQLEQWTDKDGNRRSRLGVVLESFQFAGGQQGGGRAESREPAHAHAGGGPVEEDYDPPAGDDLPF